MISDLGTRHNIAGYEGTSNCYRAAKAAQSKANTQRSDKRQQFLYYKNHVDTCSIGLKASKNAVFTKSACPNAKALGASGSWAEPYFACHLRCKWGFAYPPGILDRVFTGML